MSKIIRKNMLKTLLLILLFSLALTAMAEIYGIEDVTEDVKTENTQHLGGDMVWEDWEVRLTAISSAGGMDWAKFGADENATHEFDLAFDEPEPPAPPFSPIIQAYFYYQGYPVSTLNVSYITTSVSMTWRLILYADIRDVSNATNITLEWNAADIENVPSEYYLTLHTSNDSINMREEYNYTFSAATGYYDFDITAMIDVTLPEISNVSVYPDPQIVGGYVNISADVIDIELDEVFLYLLYPDMTEEYFSITQNKTGDTYYCNRTYHQLGVHTFHIWANDSSGFSNVSANYTFEMTNQPPYNPSNPDPYDGETNVDINADLSWTGGDPDGHPVTYDVYFGNVTPPPSVETNCPGTTYDPGLLDFDTTYYWQIVARDEYGAESTGPIWNFTTEAGVNNPPNTPSNPNPGNGATGVDFYAVLSWTGGDPDPGDTVTYDVYLGTTSPPPQVASNQSSTTYDPWVLQPVTTYFWKIVAYDSQGLSTSGPIWSFTTKPLPADYMMVESAICVPGETGKTIYINGRWSEEIQAYTFALFFDPELIEIDHGSFVGTVGQTADIQICETAEPGVFTVGAVWLVGGYPPAGSGPLLKLVVNISANATPGERILLHLDDYEPSFICLYMNTEFPPMPIYPELIDGILTITDVTCGDCNNDGIINLGDVVKLINYLYRGGDPPIPYTCVGDVTCDGVVNLGDVVKLINYLYRGGDPPCQNCCSPP